MLLNGLATVVLGAGLGCFLPVANTFFLADGLFAAAALIPVFVFCHSILILMSK